MLVIGITGGTGAGKTTVLEELERMGAFTIDCDALYHELLKGSADMLSEIEKEFPGTVKDGLVDRKALGKLVFSDAQALKRLNAITHKYVAQEVENRLLNAERAGKTLAGIDAIALIESGLGAKCDVIIGVIAPEEQRISRLMKREGITREYALLRIRAQKENDFFERNCDHILNNSYATVQQFRLQCRELLSSIIGKERDKARKKNAD
ncbi:MAG: dephospho-CoA kinase [Clostridiales bacterium]|jgi:dephospho-CoA kinase|nr:dephospho-CoA kinase [Clostridiales bacterium]